MRIEDDVYITADGVELLTQVPRTVEEIEAWMAEGRRWEINQVRVPHSHLVGWNRRESKNRILLMGGEITSTTNDKTVLYSLDLLIFLADLNGVWISL